MSDATEVNEVGATITSLRVDAWRAPMPRPWGPDVVDIGLIATEVSDSDGHVGHGFSWTPSRGLEAVDALLRNDITRFVVGRPATPDIWTEVWLHLHEAGGGGVTTIAMAGLDLALWDLRCRRRGHGLVEDLGRRHDTQPAYGSGVNLHYSLDDLVAQAMRWVDAGFSAIKIKIGKPDLAEDLDRVAAVREVLGPERDLMVDANQRWDLDRATAAAAALAEYDIAWLEEPLRANDLLGHIELSTRTDIPIAIGENLHDAFAFDSYLTLGACDIVQPNAVRVGGITPFLEIASVARHHGAQLAPHLLPDLSGQLAIALPETTWVEDVEQASFVDLGALDRSPVTIDGGRASVGPTQGLGLRLRLAPN